MIVSSGTLGGIVALGYRLTAYCEDGGCRHSAEIDLDAMIALHGADAPVQGPLQIGRGMLVCGQCGNRNCSMRLGLANGPQMSR
jgi:hypothetical protein